MHRGDVSKKAPIARETLDSVSVQDTPPPDTTFQEPSHQATPLLDKQEQKTFEDFLKQFEGSNEDLFKQQLTRVPLPDKAAADAAHGGPDQLDAYHLTEPRPTMDTPSSESKDQPNTKAKTKDPGASRSRKRKSTTNNGEGATKADPKTPGRGKKGAQELLTEEEKKANHIASEQKRRQNIRLGFEQLVEIVPTLSQCHRSESAILQKSVEYIKQLLSQKQELQQRIQELANSLGESLDDSSSSDDNT
ncbi:hypothetical protein K493DRAFT_274227 [Basidiobolus meristosporus CBS 931.73]|uniref:BHLH domain-containing protein n=1 Tax=Basidiobolus meristosporus CBS 931.73 TaxID=1314790 RepID=A0A1Y1Z8N2_9FUNG|nr:hypothetical protein K493DRAFT_274227 [Basidiobolus meristosporus CBS 931.73]|eukprot:ORY06613.1 hypothetical protein K493DRAFT_274227 [Basidiobolus meristosporus CBS 931.73]